MQILCIETSVPRDGEYYDENVKKGELYTSTFLGKIGVLDSSGIDLWHRLAERIPDNLYSATLFIGLPSQEGQSFRKEETVEIPQKLQPFYAQL